MSDDEIIKIIDNLKFPLEGINFDRLELYAKHENWEIRNAVAIILAQTDHKQGEKILLELVNDTDELIRANACDSLGSYSSESVIKVLKKKAVNDLQLVRGYAVLSLGNIAFRKKDEDIHSFLKSASKKEKSIWVKINLYYNLCILGEIEYVYEIIREIDNKFYKNRYLAIQSLLDLYKEHDFNKNTSALYLRKKICKRLEKETSKAVYEIGEELVKQLSQ